MTVRTSNSLAAPPPADESTPTPTFSRQRRRWPILGLLFLVALLLGVFLPPFINANRLRGRITSSISAAIGRPVALESVSLRLMPRPGFQLSNFTIAEDPAFGYEPVLRAPQVLAVLRVLPLWRGRLEFSNITLTDPSLNLTADEQGRWNFETVFTRSAPIATAPTGNRSLRFAQPAFPYIQVTGGRINFKRGLEKLPFSFTEADFSLWLENPNEWRLRFVGRPVRTDFSASDNGVVRGEASILRVAGSGFALMPLSLEGSWRNAPLGQITRLISGRDSSWTARGEFTFNATGSLHDAALSANLRLDGLRRTDFVPPGNLDLQATCSAAYLYPARSVTDIACTVPAGDGHISVQAERIFKNVRIGARDVPASLLLRLAQRIRPGISSELSAAGTLNGEFAWFTAGPRESDRETLLNVSPAGVKSPRKPSHLPFRPLTQPGLTGHALVSNLVLSGANLAEPLTIASLHFTAAPDPRQLGRLRGRIRGQDREVDFSKLLSIRLDPAEVEMGGAGPLALAGIFAASGYDLQLSGWSDLEHLTTVGAAAGWIKPISSDWHLAGSADLALHLGGPWFEASGFESPASPHPAGTLHLTHVSATPPFLPGTVTVESALLDFASVASSPRDASRSTARLRWTGISANWNGAHFDGTVDRALVCGPQTADCPWHINLHASALSTAGLNRAFRARSNGLLSGLLPSGSSLSQNFLPQNFLNQHFIGSIRADSFLLGPLPLTAAVAEIEIQNNSLHLVSFSGRAIGGQIGAHGTLDFAHQKHAVAVELAGGNLQDAAALFHEEWGRGTLSFTCDLKLAGGTAAELRPSAAGNCAWSIAHGGLTALNFSETPLAHFDQLSGTAKVGEELLQLSATTTPITASDRAFELIGSIGFSRSIALHLTAPPDSPMVVTGSLEAPQIQHQAKPEIQSLPKN